MGEANLYVVTFYQEDKRSGGCFPVTREELAYSAQDARAQVELSFEGVSPPDPYFRVLKIEPKREKVKV
jgi:hypothetical protein